jgi:hypothetical protein
MLRNTRMTLDIAASAQTLFKPQIQFASPSHSMHIGTAMMMVDTSSFSAETVRVLRVINDAGIIRGFELQRRAELADARALQDAITPLVKKGFITASDPLDASSIHYNQFAPLPSARDAVSVCLSKA